LYRVSCVKWLISEVWTVKVVIGEVWCFSVWQSYFGVEVESIVDSVKRSAVRTMIRTTGQTPKQLFRAPHASASLTDRASLSDMVCLAHSLSSWLNFKHSYHWEVFQVLCYRDINWLRLCFCWLHCNLVITLLV